MHPWALPQIKVFMTMQNKSSSMLSQRSGYTTTKGNIFSYICHMLCPTLKFVFNLIISNNILTLLCQNVPIFWVKYLTQLINFIMRCSPKMKFLIYSLSFEIHKIMTRLWIYKPMQGKIEEYFWQLKFFISKLHIF